MTIPYAVYIYMSGSLLSFFGSLAIILFQYRSESSQILSQQLLLRMAYFDAVYSLSGFIVIYPDTKPLVRCKYQAFLEQSSSMGVFISCFLLSYYTYKSISSKDYQSITRSSLIYTLAYSIILASIPIIKQQTYSTQFRCMFGGVTKGNGDGEILLIFYLPLIVLLTGSLLFFIISLNYIRKIKQIDGKTVEIQAAEEILKNMFMYPLIFGFCWTGYIIERLSGLICSTCNPKISDAAIISVNYFQGFLNSLVFMYNIKQSKKIIKSRLIQEIESDSNLSEYFMKDNSQTSNKEEQIQLQINTEYNKQPSLSPSQKI